MTNKRFVRCAAFRCIKGPSGAGKSEIPVETTIRIMSRWSKQDIVRTEKDGFLVIDRRALEILGLS